MKLQFKTENLLKKVEGLIIKDIAARKEHNRKVDIINSKVDEYIKKKEQQRQSEIEKAEAILEKYSDDELCDLFFEKEVVVDKKGWFREDVYESYKSMDDTVTIEGVDFKLRSDIFDLYLRLDKDTTVRDIVVDRYWVNAKEDLIHSKDDYKIRPVISTLPVKVVTPYKESEYAGERLYKLRNKCLQAKRFDIEECILEDEDLTLLNYYSNVVYKPSLDKCQLEFCILSGISHTLWFKIIDEDELL